MTTTRRKTYTIHLIEKADLDPVPAADYADMLALLIEQTEKSPAILATMFTDLQKGFVTEPDGTFFVISGGTAMPLTNNEDDLPEKTDLTVPIKDSQVAADETYAIVVFGDFMPGARSILAESIFQARAIAQTIAGESDRIVSLGRKVGELEDGTILFQGIEFIRFESDASEEKVVHRPRKKDETKTKKADYYLEKQVSFMEVSKEDEMKRIVFGVVYTPNEIDAHDDFVSTEEVEETAHKFMIAYRHDPTVGMDKQHDEILRDADIVQSFIADPSDVRFKDDPGAWVIAVKVHDNGLWNEIMSGEITGFSLMGVAGHVETGKKPD